MKTIQVELGNRSYPIHVQSGLRQTIPSLLKEKNHGQKWVIISQHRLMEFFGFELMNQLKDEAFDVDYLTLPVGEAAKSLNEFTRLISDMITMKCDRSTTILALGGGVVGDVAGFVASSFMRGVEYFQIPTTLLAMVDSSIGGKTGINIAEGKNLVGSIYQPKGVLVDPQILDSLPKEEVVAGLGEVIKYGAIWDREFFNNISTWLDDIETFPFEEAVHRACKIKAEIVSKDEHEGDLRRLLNFGHTVGHALEAHFGYGRIRHGEAVALGMKCAGWVSKKIGSLSSEDESHLVETINKLKLPSVKRLDPNTILSFVKKDKKVRNGVLHFVILNEIGIGDTSINITEELIKKSLRVIQ